MQDHARIPWRTKQHPINGRQSSDIILFFHLEDLKRYIPAFCLFHLISKYKSRYKSDLGVKVLPKDSGAMYPKVPAAVRVPDPSTADPKSTR